jgi:putative ABC transport system permease protein
MKYLPFIFRNLFRKKTRTILTIGSIAVALFLFGLLVTIETALNAGVDVAGVDRLIVRNKISLIMPLPLSYQERLRQTPIATSSPSSRFPTNSGRPFSMTGRAPSSAG